MANFGDESYLKRIWSAQPIHMLAFLRLTLLVSLLFGFEAIAQDQTRSLNIFKSQVHPFLQKRCAQCHFEENGIAPEHSSKDVNQSYKIVRTLLGMNPDFNPDWMTSTFVTTGGNMHCQKEMGEQKCGATKEELMTTLKNWLASEKDNNVQVPQRSTVEINQNPVERTTKTAQKLTRKSNPYGFSEEKLKNLWNEHVVQIVAHLHTACAIFASKKAKCWGGMYFKYEESREIQIVTSIAAIPLLPIQEPILQIALGNDHACVLVETKDNDAIINRVKCWGSNRYGQLGIESGIRSFGYNPGEVYRLEFVNIKDSVKQITSGDNHTCALLYSGKAKCWGDNEYGQLGTDKPASMGNTKRDLLKSTVQIEESIQKIVAKLNHTCALLTTGKMKCWGDNTSGQLGIEDTGNIGRRYRSLRDLPAINLKENVKDIWVGLNQSCAIFEGGTAKCWGANSSGILGFLEKRAERFYDYFFFGDYGNTPGSLERLPNIVFDHPIEQLVTGQDHACALLSNGAARCWGKNLYGQVGQIMDSSIHSFLDSNNVNIFRHLGKLPPIKQIASGHNFNCALFAAVNSSSTPEVKCWGQNAIGQLGTGDTFNRPSVYDRGPLNFSRVILP